MRGGGGGQKGHVSRSPAFRAEELRSYFCVRPLRGALVRGATRSCQAPPLSGQDHCSPRRKGLGLGDEPPHAALRGDTGQPLPDQGSARGGTGGFLEAGERGREVRAAFL